MSRAVSITLMIYAEYLAAEANPLSASKTT